MSEITRVLASDEFQGRSMGGPGEEKTVAYLTEQFKAAGLEPGGENGGCSAGCQSHEQDLETCAATREHPQGDTGCCRACNRRHEDLRSKRDAHGSAGGSSL